MEVENACCPNFFFFFMSLLSDYLLKLVRQLTKKKFINLLVNGIGMEGSFIDMISIWVYEQTTTGS